MNILDVKYEVYQQGFGNYYSVIVEVEDEDFVDLITNIPSREKAQEICDKLNKTFKEIT